MINNMAPHLCFAEAWLERDIDAFFLEGIFPIVARF